MNKKVSGFTLVELMIGLVISLIILLAAGQAFLTSRTMFDASRGYLEEVALINFSTNTIIGDFSKASSFFSSGEEVDPDDDAVRDELQLRFEPGLRDDLLCEDDKLVKRKQYELGADAVTGLSAVFVRPYCDGDSDFRSPVAVLHYVSNGGLRFKRVEDSDNLAWQVEIDFFSPLEQEEKTLRVVSADRTRVAAVTQE